MEASQTLTESSTGVDRPVNLEDAYERVRGLTEALAEPLSPEDQTVQTMPDVSPTKWHRAHTTWFFETFLLNELQPGYTLVDPEYRFLFNSYYEAVGPRHARPERGLLSRPGVAEIGAYREAVDEAMAGFLTGHVTNGDSDRPAFLVELGLHHEQQHQELLLMDIKHVLSVNPLLPPYREAPAESSAAASVGLGGLSAIGTTRSVPGGTSGSRGWFEHAGGVVEIGHPGDGFAFDNEGPRHQVLLQPFAVRSTLTTCGDWLEFMADGGYEQPDLWMSDGWGAVRQQEWEAPAYWHRSGDGWQVFTLDGVRPVDPAEPVCHVSWYEADAFARWAGCRLPSEAEWEVTAVRRLASSAAANTEPAHPEPELAPGLDLAALADGRNVLHPSPVSWGGAVGAAGATGPAGANGPNGRSVIEQEQWLGTVWQWTASSYSPYPGFAPAAGAVGEYNGKFMVNQKVLRGGACITPSGHTRPTYRNFFYPASRWPFCGLRLAASR